MATARERRAYASRLRQIARSFDRLERATLQQSIALLRDVRNSLAGQLIDTDFSRFRIAEQQQVLDDIIANYEAQARALANGSVRGSFTLGEQAVVEPLQAANVGAAFFRPSTAQVETLAQFSADLISGVAGKMRTDINRVIQLNALGGQSSIDAMRDITQLLFKSSRPPSPRTRQPVKGVAYEAERILRTETNRAYSLATFGQQEALARDVPGLQKQWMATGDGRTRLSHLEAHGKIVDVDKPFIVGGEELMYPLDPKGGPAETINCRCTSVTVIPEIGPVETPLDKEIEEEKARRDKEKAEKAVAGLPAGYSRELKEAYNIFELDDPFDEGYTSGSRGKLVRGLSGNEIVLDFDRAGGSVPGGPGNVTQKFYSNWHSELSSDQKKALQRYSGGEYKNMNSVLRHGKILGLDNPQAVEVAKRDIAVAVSSIESSNPLPANIRVYRRFGRYNLNNLSIGDIVEDKGFMSTTLSKESTDLNFTGTIAEITVPKDTRAAFLGWTDVANHPEELEMLFAPGSKMRVVDKITDSEGVARVIMEMFNG
jgi:hypothetical protein